LGIPASTSTMATVLTKGRIKASKYGSTEETTALLSADVAPLGVPLNEKRFFWQRRRGPDPDAIATQVGRSHHSRVGEELTP
jgi:MFS transporter, ACS family, DAL5 transporter family protein